MITISFLLLLLAFVCILLAAFRIGTPRIDLGWLGLAFWLFSLILGQIVPITLHR